VKRSVCVHVTVLAAMLAAPAALSAQWTVRPGGWFMSQSLNKGRFPDRFSPGEGEFKNALEKVDWGLYFIYGLAEGWSVGLGQGFAHLEDKRNGTTTTTTGFGATGLFLLKRLAQGKAGVLSIQPRVDLPLFYNTNDRPVLGPVKAEAELRLLYGTGYGLGATRGFVSTSLGGSAWRHGDDEIRYDATVGLDVVPSRLLLMAQTFNVVGLQSGGGVSYSATKVGGSVVWHVSKAIGLVAGYYGGIAGKNTARERTASIGIWWSREPRPELVRDR
jgi:hypothetical protein